MRRSIFALLTAISLVSACGNLAPAYAQDADEKCATPEYVVARTTMAGYGEAWRKEDVTDSDGHYDLVVVYAKDPDDPVFVYWFLGGCVVDMRPGSVSQVSEYIRAVTGDPA
jgi:hypothetical protein